jgi:hypothetical protein
MVNPTGVGCSCTCRMHRDGFLTDGDVSVASRAARIASEVTGLENPEPPRSFCSIVCLFVFVTKKCRGREQRPAFPFAVPRTGPRPRPATADRCPVVPCRLQYARSYAAVPEAVVCTVAGTHRRTRLAIDSGRLQSQHLSRAPASRASLRAKIAEAAAALRWTSPRPHVSHEPRL